MPEEVIQFDSEQAATYRTDIRGWVSRTGLYFGDDPGSERAARYAGCTHRPCKECGKPTLKSRVWCDVCETCRRRKKWEDREEVEWDGKSYLFSETTDTYYNPDWDLDDLFEDMVELGLTQVRAMGLVQCEPNYVRELDSSYVEDLLPYDDPETPKELEEAIAQFNARIRGIILSWSPGKTRVKTDTEYWKKFEQDLIEKFAEDENE